LGRSHLEIVAFMQSHKNKLQGYCELLPF